MSSNNTDTKHNSNTAGSSPAPSEAHPRADEQQLEVFGDVIYAYTRAQAIADGVLMDVSETAKEVGFRIPVALTQAVWADCIEWSEADSKRQVHQDEAGRLWDVLWLASVAALRRPDASALVFSLYRVPRGGRATRSARCVLKMICGPGDDGAPVITILQPHED